jgi:uncharacterized protein YecE (DUF72 family)
VTAVIKTGITSWADRSLVGSGFYPRGTSSAEARLRYYASQFPIVENDSAYYALPTKEQALRWVERTPQGFTMNVKAYASLTEHYTDPERLPRDLRQVLPSSVLEKKRAYPKDLGAEVLSEIAIRFREALEPLRASGRLGVVLFQYPVWFNWTRDHEEQVAFTHELVPGCRVAIEFRNATWLSDRHRARTFALLRNEGLSFTSVDEPQGFPSSLPPVAEATSDIAVVRFHGRMRDRWNRASETASERFQYLYSSRELLEWVPKIRSLAERTRETHVLMNNCWRDYAVVNAREMDALLREEGRAAAGAPP